MEKTFRRDWILGSGVLVIGGAIVLGPLTETIRDATDVCGIARQVIACAPAPMPDSDLPHRDHFPTTTGNISTTVTSTATALTLGTSPSTTVTGNRR